MIIIAGLIIFQVYIVKDKWASVRATAVTVLSHCLSLISHLPRRYPASAPLPLQLLFNPLSFAVTTTYFWNTCYLVW